MKMKKRIRRYFRPPVSGYYQEFTFFEYMKQYAFLYILFAIAIALMYIFDMPSKEGLTIFLVVLGTGWLCGGIYTYKHDFVARQNRRNGKIKK